MEKWKCVDVQGMSKINRHDCYIVAVQFFGDELRQICRQTQLPDLCFDSDFPARGGTEKQLVGSALNRGIGGFRKSRIIVNPPQKRMGIEQDLHVGSTI